MPYKLVPLVDTEEPKKSRYKLTPRRGERPSLEKPVKQPVVPTPQEKKEPSVVSKFKATPLNKFLHSSFTQPIKTFSGGMQQAQSNLFGTLDFYADKIAGALNLPETKNSIFEKLSKDSQYWADKLGKEGISDGVMREVYSGLGTAAFDIPVKYMGPGKFLKGATLPVMGAVEGYQHAGAKGALTGAATGALTHGSLKGLGTLPTKLRLPAAFGFGAATTPGGVKEKVAGGAIWTALSAGKGPSMEEFKRTQVQHNALVRKGNQFYQDIFNRFHSIEDVVARAKAMGVDIKPGEDAGMRARGYLGIGGKAERMLNDSTFTISPEGKIVRTGEGLKPILTDYGKMAKGNKKVARQDLVDYLVAKRTINDLQRTPKGGKKQIVTKEQVAKAKATMDNLQKKYGLAPHQSIENLVFENNKTPKVLFRGVKEKGTLEGTGFSGEQWVTSDFKTAKAYAGKKGKVFSTPFDDTVRGDFRIEDGVRQFHGKVKNKVFSDTSGKMPFEAVKGSSSPNFFEPTAQRLYGYQKRVLQLMADSGLKSQAEVNAILQKNPHYIPFDRVMDGVEAQSVSPTTKHTFSKPRQPIKGIKGSERDIANPIESIIGNTYKILDAAERNTVARGVTKLSSVFPQEISPVTPQIVPVATIDGKPIFRPTGRGKGRNIVTVYEGGARKYYEVSNNLYQAMSGLSEQSSSLLTRVMAQPANWVRSGATLVPEFAFRNPIRDQFTAFLQTNFGFKPFIDPLKAMGDIMGKNQTYYDFLASGGAYSTLNEISRKQLQIKLKELTSSRGRKLLKRLNIITNAKDISQLFEMSTRVGVYERAVKSGLSPVEAGFQARESTVDFARRGAKTKDINATIAFFNAGLQGLDKSARTAIADPVGLSAKALATITLPSVLLHMRNRKDPDFKEIPQWQRDLFWVTKVGDTYVRIPKPFGYGQLFGSAVERFMNYAESKDPKAFDNFDKTLLQAFSPIGSPEEAAILPNAVKPLIENATNWNFFLQRNIVPESQQRLLPKQQAGTYTSETAKAIGKAINYSPAKIENLVRGYAAGAGKYALQGGDLAINQWRRMSGEILPENPVEAADIPLVKGFVVRNPIGPSAESIQNFYNTYDKITKAHNSIKSLLETDNSKEALSIVKGVPEVKLISDGNAVSRELGSLRKRRNAIRNMILPPVVKSKLYKNIDEQMVGIAKGFNLKVKGIK